MSEQPEELHEQPGSGQQGLEQGRTPPGPGQVGPGSGQAGPGSGQAGPGSGQVGPGSGQAGPGSATDARQTALEARSELRERARELRELSRQRGEEIRELARAQREVKREQMQELREMARAQRQMARGLRARQLEGRQGREGSAGDGGQAGGDERNTRERILDVALDIFVEQGYDKASLREIAERMGFTKAALYYHFPSKADMLMALHERMHAIIDEPLTLLGDGTVSVETWERFLDACIDRLQGNQKLFQMHRVNQAALAGVHSENHGGAHQDLEERALKIFSEPSLKPEYRLRMAAAFAVSFITPFMAGGMFPDADEDFLLNGLREIVHRVLQPEVAKRDAEDIAGVAKRETESLAGVAKREAESVAGAAKSQAENIAGAAKREAEKSL